MVMKYSNTIVPITQELLDDARPPRVKPRPMSSTEMIRQGYRDARRKRFNVGGPVPRVSDVLLDSIHVGKHAADALGQQIMTEIMEMSR